MPSTWAATSASRPKNRNLYLHTSGCTGGCDAQTGKEWIDSANCRGRARSLNARFPSSSYPSSTAAQCGSAAAAASAGRANRVLTVPTAAATAAECCTVGATAPQLPTHPTSTASRTPGWRRFSSATCCSSGVSFSCPEAPGPSGGSMGCCRRWWGAPPAAAACWLLPRTSLCKVEGCGARGCSICGPGVAGRG